MSRYWEIEVSKEDAEKVMPDVMYAVKLFWSIRINFGVWLAFDKVHYDVKN